MAAEKSSQDSVIYTPLPPETIRLFTFDDGSKAEPIQVSIEAFDIHECPPYITISYAWGDSRADSAIEVGTGEGVRATINVRTDLHEVLRYVNASNELSQKYFWVDSICINQDDREERAEQVALMWQIYRGASITLICIGGLKAEQKPLESLALSTDAFQDLLDMPLSAITALRDRGYSDDLRIAREAATSYERFMSIGWWKRTWVVQEALFSRECVFTDGQTQMRLPELTRSVELSLLAASLYRSVVSGSGRQPRSEVPRMMIKEMSKHMQRILERQAQTQAPPAAVLIELQSEGPVGSYVGEDASLLLEADILRRKLADTPYIFRLVYMRDAETHIWFTTSRKAVERSRSPFQWVTDSMPSIFSAKNHHDHTNSNSVAQAAQMYWKCQCGKTFTAEIAQSHVEACREILQIPKDLRRWVGAQRQCRLQLDRKKLFLDALTFTAVQAVKFLSSASQAARRYSPSLYRPTEHAAEEESPSMPEQSHGGTNNEIILSPGASVITPERNASIGGVVKFPWILLGTQADRSCLEISHLGVDDETQDASMYHDIRTAVRSSRGKLRSWLSIWQLDYCQFVKLKRYQPGRVLASTLDLPESQNYSYSPRKPDADPETLIEPQEFRDNFTHCEEQCRWPHCIHDCHPPATGYDAVIRIPKKSRQV